MLFWPARTGLGHVDDSEKNLRLESNPWRRVTRPITDDWVPTNYYVAPTHAGVVTS